MKSGHSGEKSLTSRLFAIIFVSFFASFIIATAIAAYVSWTVYEGDAETRLTAQLNAYCTQIENMSAEESVSVLSSAHLADMRITLIDGSGVVLYDSIVDASDMENHANREEVLAAQKRGESVVLRKSETTGTDSLYAAALVNTDGTVLRLAESRTSLAFYLGGLLFPLIVAIILAALASALLARLITRKVSAPLLNIDLNAPLESKTYREIRPLLSRIDAQRSELKDQNMQLERAVEMRREFTGNVSHEMKSPLQVIGGYAELIEDGIASPEDTTKFARLIRSESQSMRALIDDVLMLSKLDEGACDEHQMVNVLDVVSRVVERLSSQAESAGVEIVLKVDGDVQAKGSEHLVEQALYNLVDNSIRYGGQRVEVAITSKIDKMLVSVSDDGPGIPVEERSRIFERFYRVDHSRSRSTGGTGLGLAIVKHAAESMGGSVAVDESALGGALFVLTLPKQ